MQGWKLSRFLFLKRVDRERNRNDFEENVFKKFPQLAEYKEQLYRDGALYASMSGSGSSLFGIFNK